MAPIPFKWTGEAMQPVGHFAKACDLRFVVGETYTLEEIQERSSASHRHYFACVEEAWQTLPEGTIGQFPNSTVLRKHALIACGYADERSIVCSSKAEAQRFAAWCRPRDSYAIITVSHCVVKEFTAQSQQKKAMGAKVFQESKDRVLAWIANLAGIDASELGKAA